MEADWSGEEWQEFCDPLFAERHAPSGYQRVPDRDRGDLGIEGFSLDGEGCAYQCYACEQVGVRERYESQRDKMTVDLGKLVKNRERVAALVGTHQLRRWVFVVPLHDSKELVIHARKKEEELREKGLPFLAGDFTVVIQTADDFATERALVEERGAATIAVAREEVAEAAVEQLAAEEAEQVRTMDQKLAKVSDDPARARGLMLRQAVDGDNILEGLKSHHPLIREQVARQIDTERRNVLAEREVGELHRGSVTGVRERLEGRLREQTAAIGDDGANRLSHATVARWLMECPLDFPESE
jgi:hypothetical protein